MGKSKQLQTSTANKYREPSPLHEFNEEISIPNSNESLLYLIIYRHYIYFLECSTDQSESKYQERPSFLMKCQFKKWTEGEQTIRKTAKSGTQSVKTFYLSGLFLNLPFFNIRSESHRDYSDRSIARIENEYSSMTM